MSDTTVVVLTGMHRSGTSLVAGLVRDAGVDMGEQSKLLLEQSAWAASLEKASRSKDEECTYWEREAAERSRLLEEQAAWVA